MVNAHDQPHRLNQALFLATFWLYGIYAKWLTIPTRGLTQTLCGYRKYVVNFYVTSMTERPILQDVSDLQIRNLEMNPWYFGKVPIFISSPHTILKATTGTLKHTSNLTTLYFSSLKVRYQSDFFVNWACLFVSLLLYYVRWCSRGILAMGGANFTI